MPSPATYNRISRINHWIIGLAMIGMLGLGLYLEFGGLERSAKRPLLYIHRSVGVLILIYGLWRVGYRIVQGFPPTASNGPSWQEKASKVTHWALLAGIIIMPLSGVIMTIFRGRSIDVFGMFVVPAQTKIQGLASFAGSVHGFAGKLITAIVLLHIAAALKHHFIDKDATLKRMIGG